MCGAFSLSLFSLDLHADFFCPNFPANLFNKLTQRFDALISGKAASDGNSLVGLLLLSDYQHIRNLIKPRLADLITNLFRTVINGTENAVFFNSFATSPA